MIASDGHSTDSEEPESDRGSYPYFYYYLHLSSLHLIGGFIDDETPIASGSGTQQHMVRRGIPCRTVKTDDFFDRIYERSRFRRMIVFASLQELKSFLWRIGCRVRFIEKL